MHPGRTRLPLLPLLALAACATTAAPLNLSHNDNLLGPSPALEPARRGGAPVATEVFLAALAAQHRVPPEWLLLGNGSEEILGRLVKATTAGGRGLVTHAHAYVAFRKLAEEQHLPLHEAALTADLGLDVDTLLGAVDATTALVVLASPVNPSGAYLTTADADRLATALEAKGVLLVIDAAYLEYVSAPDYGEPFALLTRHANVVVLATFSKVYGLTQPKLGFLAARPEVVARVRAVANPEVPPEAIRLASAALADQGHVESSRQASIASVESLTHSLPELGLRVWPSQGNFVMARSPVPAALLSQRMAAQGVQILDLTSYGLPDCVRITAGTPEQNTRMLAALRVSIAVKP